METLSSMFAFGVVITFLLFILGCLAQNNLMPGFVVLIMLGVYIFSRMVK